jgi:hypothetical protein
MRREIRIGLLLAATSCLLAVLVDWVVEELISEAPQAGADTPQAEVGAPPEDAEGAQATAEGSDEQG